MPFSPRTATVVLSFLGALGNFVVASHLLALWGTLRSEPESEWEGSSFLRIDGLKVVTALTTVYFSLSALACVVGFIGAVKCLPSYVRFFRDVAVADLFFSAFSTILLAFASFRPAIRSLVCDELSRQPELLQNLAEAGLNLENCEAWFERAIVAFIALMAIVLVIRLQFIMAFTSFGSSLVRDRLQLDDTALRPVSNSPPLQRIYLLPRRSMTSSATAGDVAYVPVPLDSLSPDDAAHLEEYRAWVSPAKSGSSRPHLHQHHHQHHPHSHAHSHVRDTQIHRRSQDHGLSYWGSEGQAGGIALPTHPDEPLLPMYSGPEGPKG